MTVKAWPKMIWDLLGPLSLQESSGAVEQSVVVIQHLDSHRTSNHLAGLEQLQSGKTGLPLRQKRRPGKG